MAITGVFSVDGKEYARRSMPHSIAFLMAIDGSFDVGSEPRTGVDGSENAPLKIFNQEHKGAGNFDNPLEIVSMPVIAH